MRRAMTLRRVFLLLLLVQLFNIALRPTLDPDMWWHLRTGELIWQSGIPRQDPFSFTVPAHEWITHEWLSQVFMWTIYRVGGLTGLAIVFAALAALSFWLVYRCSDGPPYPAALLVILAALVAAPSLGVRPQAFTVLMTAVFVHVIERVRKRQLGAQAMLWLPAVTLLWANLHGGYLFGIVLLIAYAAGDGLAALAPKCGTALPRPALRILPMVVAASAAAAVVNPNGWEIWRYPFDTVGSTPMQANIVEWRSPDFHLYKYWPFAFMIGLGIGTWAVGTARAGCSDLLLFLGTAFGGLLSVRHIALFAIVSTPILARTLLHALSTSRPGTAVKFAPSDGEPTRRNAQLNWALLFAGVAASAIWSAAKLRGNDSAIAAAYPVAAVDFLNRHGMNGVRGFNTYGWGGYLIWRRLPVFIDGRADVYGDEFLSRYLETFRLTERWREPLDQFGVEYVLVERTSPLATLLTATNQWRQVYADDIARIFVRIEGEEELRSKE